MYLYHLYLGITEIVTGVSVSFHNVEWTTYNRSQNLTQHEPNFNLICNFSPLATPNLLYKITWYVDSTEIPMQQVISQYMRDTATLSAKDMSTRYNIKRINVHVS